MYEEILIQNGFTIKEAKVYLAILEIGEATMSMIARRSKLERPTVYDVVKDLQQKGLAFITEKKGMKYVSALSPMVLLDRFKNSFNKAESILPDLLTMAYKSPLKPRIKFYEGMNGIKEILREYSHAEEDVYCFTDYELMPDSLRKFIWDEIIPERIKRKAYLRLLVPNNEKSLAEKAKDNIRYGEHKIMNFPKDQTISFEILLFGKKTGFLCFSKEEEFGLLIESGDIFNTLKSIFLFIWNLV